MALNIGNLNFGIDANTEGLQKAIAMLAKFEKATAATANAQKKSSTQIANARARQESAVKKAFQATLRLQQQLKRAGVPPRDIATVTQAFKRLTTEMTSGKITTVQFTRSVDAFNAKLGTMRRKLTDVNFSKHTGLAGAFNKQIRNLESASVLAIGPLSGLGARIRAMSSIITRANLAAALMFATFAAGVVVIGKLVASAISASKAFETANARFLAASGSIEIANKQMAFVINTSNELGLKITDTAKAFSRLTAAARGSALEGQGVRNIFSGISKAAAALRLSSADVEGTFRAIEQIMSKGTVQAEELRGQLGERLPGAFVLAARAMKTTTAGLGDMLKAGLVLSDDFLPKFVDEIIKAFGDRARDNVNSFTGSMNLLSNAALLFSKEFDNVFRISDIFIGAIKSLTKFVNFMRSAIENATLAVGALSGAMIALALPAIIGLFAKLAFAIRAAALSMVALNVATLANPIGGLINLFSKLAIAIVGAIAGIIGFSLVMGESEEALRNMNDALEALEKGEAPNILRGRFKELQKELDDGLTELILYSDALNNLGRTESTLDDLLRFFTAVDDVTETTERTLEGYAKTLSKILMRPVAADARSVANAFAQFRKDLDLARDSITDYNDKVKFTAKLTKDIEVTTAMLTARLAALQEGAEGGKFFNKVTKQAEAFRKELAKSNKSLAEQNRLFERRLLLLKAVFEAEEEAAKRKKDRAAAAQAEKKALSDSLRNLEKISRVIVRFDNTMDLIKGKLAALAEGPRSLRIFEQITVPLERMRAVLAKVIKDVDVLNAMLAQYEEVLRKVFLATEAFSIAGEQAADAFLQSIENIILKTETLKESIKNLARELFRLFLRIALLDPLKQSLGSAFGSIFKKVKPPGKSAAGSVFKVGGSGTADSQHVSFLATPGEQVSVMRPDQRGAARFGGGGGLNLTMNFPGADAGTIGRLKEVIRVELVPQIIQAASDSTLARFKRPRFA